MKIKIDRESKTPIYIQIRNHIRSMIFDGELPPGYVLPPERKLAEYLGINRSTVLNSYRELKSDGIVESHVGKGTVVLSHLTNVSSDAPKYSPPLWRQYFSQSGERSSDPLLKELLEIANRRDIISFAAGISSLDTDPVECLRGIEEELITQPEHFALKHTPTEGFPSLRENISLLMQKRGIQCTPEQIMVLSGSQQGIDIAGRVFIDPGDVVVVEEPSFFSALNIFQAAGARIVGVPVDDKGMNIDILEHVTQRYRPKFIYTMPTYQNPSGISMSLERRKHLLEIAYSKKILIIEDDPYGDLRYEGNRLPSLKELDKYGYVIYLSTFSKILFPGIRVGWLVAPKPVVTQFGNIKQLCDLHANSISQWIVDRFLSSGNLDAHIKRLCGQYCIKRNIMINSLLEDPVEGLEWNKPLGGFYLWCKLPSRVPSMTLMVKASENGVAYVPGSAFYQANRGENYIRLNFTYPSEEDIRMGIKILKDSIRESMESSSTNKNFDKMEIKPIV